MLLENCRWSFFLFLLFFWFKHYTERKCWTDTKSRSSAKTKQKKLESEWLNWSTHWIQYEHHNILHWAVTLDRIEADEKKNYVLKHLKYIGLFRLGLSRVLLIITIWTLMEWYQTSQCVWSQWLLTLNWIDGFTFAVWNLCM